MNKYSTLALYIMRRRAFDVYRASVPDEYFFIVYSMVNREPCALTLGFIAASKGQRPTELEFAEQ